MYIVIPNHRFKSKTHRTYPIRNASQV